MEGSIEACHILVDVLDVLRKEMMNWGMYGGMHLSMPRCIEECIDGCTKMYWGMYWSMYAKMYWEMAACIEIYMVGCIEVYQYVLRDVLDVSKYVRMNSDVLKHSRIMAGWIQRCILDVLLTTEFCTHDAGVDIPEQNSGNMNIPVQLYFGPDALKYAMGVCVNSLAQEVMFITVLVLKTCINL
jgi:hypothetical protein